MHCYTSNAKSLIPVDMLYLLTLNCGHNSLFKLSHSERVKNGVNDQVMIIGHKNI